MNKDLLKAVAYTAGGLVVGYTAGYFITKKRLERQLAEQLQVEINEVKAFYQKENDNLKKLSKTAQYSTPEDAVEALANKPEVLTEEEAEKFNGLVEGQGYAEESKLTVSQNIWETPLSELRGANDDPIVQEPETENEANWPGNPDGEDEPTGDMDENPEGDTFEIIRSADHPYIISVEEYMTDDDDFEKVSFAFYDEDGVLLDESDRPVPDVEGIVGIMNLHHFGLHSGSKNTLYVRNERINHDIEIHLDEGSYSEAFLGVKLTDKQKDRHRRARNNE